MSNDNKRFLGNCIDKADAIKLRDDIAKQLVELGWTPEITVGIAFTHGAGGWGVWLHKQQDAEWPEPPLMWHAAMLIKQSDGRNRL